MRFLKHADDEEKSKSKEFRRIVRKLREALDIQKDGHIIQGNTFHASFGEFNDGSHATDNAQGTGTAPP